MDNLVHTHTCVDASTELWAMIAVIRNNQYWVDGTLAGPIYTAKALEHFIH